MTCGDLLQLCRTAVVGRNVWLDPEWQKRVDKPVVIRIQLSAPCQRYVHYHKLYFLSLHFQNIEGILSQAPSPICSFESNSRGEKNELILRAQIMMPRISAAWSQSKVGNAHA